MQALEPDKVRTRGRPRKNWVSSTEPSSVQTQAGADAISRLNLISKPDFATEMGRPNLNFNFVDLELFHQFLNMTCVGLPGPPGFEECWQANIMIMARNHPFILNLACGLSALHLAHLNPNGKQQYVVDGERHFQEGLRGITKALRDIDAGNCQALYLSAVLACFYTFGKGPARGDFLVSGEKEVFIWLPMIHGVRSISGKVGSSVLFSGILSPGRSKSAPSITHRMTAPPDWESHLSTLRQHVFAHGTQESERFDTAFSHLEKCFEGVYGRRGHPPVEYSDAQTILAWFFTLDDNFLACLSLRQPITLIILAYAVVLLKELDILWFVLGWSEHIINSVHELLDDNDRSWLEWPKQQISPKKPI